MFLHGPVLSERIFIHFWGSPRRFGEQGNTGNLAMGTREQSEKIIGNKGTSNRLGNRGGAEIVEGPPGVFGEQGNTGNLAMGTREHRPPLGDPQKLNKRRGVYSINYG